MPQFRYRAARPDGATVEELMDADSEGAVRSQLEGKGWLVLNVEGARRLSFSLPQWQGSRLSLREFLVFNQEFVALVKAGLPILKSCELLAARAPHAGFKAALQGVRTEIHGGASISEAMGKYPEHFPELYRASIRSGEHSGHLLDVLQRYIAYVKLVISTKEKVVKAMAYPAFLIIVGIAVVAFLLIYVMPTFAEIYGQSRADLPVPTKLLLAAVENVRHWLPWLVAGAFGLGAAGYRWMHTETGRQQVDRLSLHVPIIGDVLLKNQIVRMARTLSTVLAGGIPMLTALQITSGAITNRVLSQAIARATDRVREGVGLAASLKQEGFLPQMTLEMIEVGETTGSLETMLHDVAEFHEGELDLRLSQLTTWIEPALLLIMGFVVGGIVIVMYLPVFQIAGTV
ncbi:MAG: type II secretion system F family protein [Nitrospiraceae bacterium]